MVEPELGSILRPLDARPTRLYEGGKNASTKAARATLRARYAWWAVTSQ
jgi:hypothetical protein